MFQVLQYGLHFLFYLSIQEDGCMILVRTDWLLCQRRLFPDFFSVDVFVLADAIKNVQPISQCVLTSVSFIENHATLGPGSRDPGSLWCYCWITEGIGQQICRGLSAGWDWPCCVLQNGPNSKAALPELLNVWGSSTACCVMQNNVIFSMYWNRGMISLILF